MNYMKLQDFQLKCVPSSESGIKYTDLDSEDIKDAIYTVVNGISDNPDIAALPELLTPKKLFMVNAKIPSGCGPDVVKTLSKPDRLAGLVDMKDSMRITLPFLGALERNALRGLVSTYKKRQYAKDDESKSIRSMAQPIASSSFCTGLIGTSGTGKSTAMQMVLNRYPKAIRHTFVDNGMNRQYVQIPFLAVSAYAGRDMKNLLYSFAKRIDDILDFGGYYLEEMTRKKNVSKMSSYFIDLIERFHIGCLVIDEIQLLMKKGEVFEQLLSIMQNGNISVIIIGTEDAIDELNKTEWMNRRFGQIGKIQTNISPSDDEYLEHLIQTVWSCQWTKERFKLTSECLEFLKKESAGNIDFLTTLIIQAQFHVIMSEGTATPLKLDLETLKKTAKEFPFALKLIKGGNASIEEAYLNEKKRSLALIQTEMEKQQRSNDLDASMNNMDLFSATMMMKDDVISRITALHDYSRDEIEKAIDSLQLEGKDLVSMLPKERASLVMAEMLQARDSKKQKQNSIRSHRKAVDYKAMKTELESAIKKGDDETSLV